MKKTKGFLLAVAIAAITFTFSCSSDSEEDRDSRLVCANGEAWVDVYYGSSGEVFRQNGDWLSIQKVGSNWSVVTNDVVASVQWSTSGDKILVDATSTDGRSVSGDFPYSISNDTLTLDLDGRKQSYTKQKGIYPE